MSIERRNSSEQIFSQGCADGAPRTQSPALTGRGQHGRFGFDGTAVAAWVDERPKVLTLECAERRANHGGSMQATRILIIEDDAGSRNALTAVLRDEGFEVCAAACGEDGIRCVVEFQPQFAIIDVHLPDANGIELMHELRGLNPDCACVIASGSASFRTKDGTLMLMDFSEEARAAGAIDYFCKPINVDRLLDTLGETTTG